MPWKESSAMSLRYEFVTFALCHSSNIRELCRRFEISSKTGYKWISRYIQEDMQGLKDRSKRPHSSPGRTADELEKNSLSLFSEVADQIDYYFVRGDNLDRVIHGYRLITGKAPMMPQSPPFSAIAFSVNTA